MSQRWYYQLFSEEFGPVTEPQIRQLLNDGTLDGDDLVRPETSQSWLSLSESLPDIAESNAGAGELTDLSELEFSFEESRTSTRKTATHTADVSGRAQRFDERNSSGRETLSRSASPTPEPAPVMTSTAPALLERVTPSPQGDTTVSQVMYYCQSFGQTMGPMPISELAGMAETGSLVDSDLVRCGDLGDWFPAGELAELAATLMLVDRLTPAPAATRTDGPHRLEKVAAAEIKPMREKTTNRTDAPTTPPKHSEQSRVGSDSSSGDGRERPVRKKGAPKKEKNREVAVLNEIFNEVFAEEEKPVRPTPSVHSAPTAVAGNSPAEPPRPAVVPPVAPVPLMSTSTSAMAAAAASSMRSSSGATLSSKRSSSGISLPMPGKGVVLTAVLVLAVSGYGYKFGLPSFSFSSAPPQDYSGLVQAAIAECKALGNKPTEQEWKLFADKTKQEFLTHYKNAINVSKPDPGTTACIQAMKTLITLTSARVDEVSFRNDCLAKLDTFAPKPGK